MTRHPLSTEDDRSGDAWIVGLLAGCSLLAAALTLVIATRPHTARLVSDIAQAEVAFVPPAGTAVASTPAGPVRLAARP